MHLDGIEAIQSEYLHSDHENHIDKRASSCYSSCQSAKFLNFLILLIILTLITCLFGFLACRICVELQGYVCFHYFLPCTIAQKNKK